MNYGQLLEAIESNFDAQKLVRSEIADKLDYIKTPTIFSEFVYGDKRAIAAKVRTKVKLLQRLKRIQNLNIAKLADLNNQK